jgi:hypothetical protein
MEERLGADMFPPNDYADNGLGGSWQYSLDGQ